MECLIRKWKHSDATQLAKVLSNKKILANLRDGLPYPYTEKDAEDYIATMIDADANKPYWKYRN